MKKTDHTFSRPAVSIIIPTYNGQHLLKKHVPAVVACMKEIDELIIIDDASTDTTEVWFKNWREKMLKRKGAVAGTFQYIQNITNLRFAASVNKAVRHAQNKYVFLLNNDVSPAKNVLDALWNTWQESDSPEDVFAVSCKEYEMESKQAVIGGKNMLWFERGMFIHSRAKDMTTGPTAWASGGSALFDASKWESIGGFDRSFHPAYWEDIDLSMRARKNEWSILFSEHATVEHHHETTNSSVFGQEKIALMSWKNAYIFAWKHMNRKQWISHVLWLPYHLGISGFRTNWIPFRAFVMALFTYPYRFKKNTIS